MCVGRCPYAVYDLDLLLQLTHSTSGNLVHFSFLLLSELNLDIHLHCNYAHIHSSNQFRFTIATGPWHKLQLYNLSFLIGAQPTHSFCVATVPIYIVVTSLDFIVATDL
jgi:hypothetical protein